MDNIDVLASEMRDKFLSQYRGCGLLWEDAPKGTRKAWRKLAREELAKQAEMDHGR